MDNVKPWQIILIVLALCALAFSVVKFGYKPSIESQMADKMTLVDVQTGQLYTVDVSGRRTFMFPMRNPDTREIALVPVREIDGEWFILERYVSMMEQVTVPIDAVSDPEGPVEILDADPIRIK